MPFLSRLNRFLDGLVRPHLAIAGRSVSAYRLGGTIGLLCAVPLALALTAYRGLSLPVMSLLILCALLAFFALTFASKLFWGAEQLVYYHHEIAVVSVAALVLALLGQPLLPYLDATLLGVGAFLMCGRVGCLMVGCCHGRPHRLGVRYRPEHAAAGFAPYYVGVRLFPIQAVEALTVCGIVLAGSGMVFAGAPAGAAFAWYVVAYDIARFCFEFARGDTGRPYYRGFSEAQWIALALTVLVAAAELAGLLPFAAWHAGAALALAGALLWISLLRGRAGRPARHQLLHPRHVAEIAGALESQGTAQAPVACTSQGILISAGSAPGASGAVNHYTFSWRDGVLGEGAARLLADLTLSLRHPAGRAELAHGGHATYHLIVRP